MRAVVQRVSEARVSVSARSVGEIGKGLLVFLGVGGDDNEGDADYLAEKIAGLRIFADDQDKMNRSAADLHAEVMVISQFTLYGDVRRGKRPSFSDAAPPESARALYEYFVRRLSALGVSKVATGEFQAMMDVSLVNAGPVTILLDSRKTF
ncbi:MAG: D-aminoacyl-tRNA deacylase [Candidatus Brocadiia bacterium]|jgi:D-tyrosyl-tRNA(Tyr) deacylase